MTPHAREAIGLQLELDRQLVRGAAIAALLAAHALLDPGEPLDVVADLVREHVRLGEVAGRAEPRPQLAVEREIDVDPLVARAIERTHLALAGAARRVRRLAE